MTYIGTSLRGVSLRRQMMITESGNFVVPIGRNFRVTLVGGGGAGNGLTLTAYRDDGISSAGRIQYAATPNLGGGGGETRFGAALLTARGGGGAGALTDPGSGRYDDPGRGGGNPSAAPAASGFGSQSGSLLHIPGGNGGVALPRVQNVFAGGPAPTAAQVNAQLGGMSRSSGGSYSVTVNRADLNPNLFGGAGGGSYGQGGDAASLRLWGGGYALNLTEHYGVSGTDTTRPRVSALPSQVLPASVGQAGGGGAGGAAWFITPELGVAAGSYYYLKNGGQVGSFDGLAKNWPILGQWAGIAASGGGGGEIVSDTLDLAIGDIIPVVVGVGGVSAVLPANPLAALPIDADLGSVPAYAFNHSALRGSSGANGLIIISWDE